MCCHVLSLSLHSVPVLPTRTPLIVTGNFTTAPGFFLDIQPLYFYIIVSAGALLLILVVVVVVTLTCACLYRRRRQSGWSDPPVYDTPIDNLPKELGKEHLGRIVIPSPLCLNVYEVESTLPPPARRGDSPTKLRGGAMLLIEMSDSALIIAHHKFMHDITISYNSSSLFPDR